MSRKKQTGKEISIVRSSSAEYLTFARGSNSKIAVKIVDDRGIESLRVISL